MGLLMVMFPALAGGHITLMSPLAFVRRPNRWIRELGSSDLPTFAAAPNFAFELAAQRGLPRPGEALDLSGPRGGRADSGGYPRSGVTDPRSAGGGGETCCGRGDPRTTSGKLARSACRAKYLDGAL